MNAKGVYSFHGVDFYRCLITKFFKTAQALAQLVLMDVISFIDACLEIFCRIKTTTTNTPDSFRDGECMIKKLDIPLLT